LQPGPVWIGPREREMADEIAVVLERPRADRASTG
jgi:hypothetical protein